VISWEAIIVQPQRSSQTVGRDSFCYAATVSDNQTNAIFFGRHFLPFFGNHLSVCLSVSQAQAGDLSGRPHHTASVESIRRTLRGLSLSLCSLRQEPVPILGRTGEASPTPPDTSVLRYTRNVCVCVGVCVRPTSSCD
jgi:hypothetical protein